MKATTLRPETPEQTGAGLSRRPYMFWPILLVAAVAGLLIRWYVGRKTYISFDEWQHVFMAGAARWNDVFFELRTNAHPLLFFVLLRGIVRWGNAALYRSISIAAGAGSIVVVGLIARKILRSPIIQSLCAIAFALSVAAISMSVEIRSYQLTVFLVLMAFLAWLSLFPGTDGRIGSRPCITFAICTSLALASHYSTVFFLGACVVVPSLMAAMFPRLRHQWISTVPKQSVWPVSLAFTLPGAVFVYEYFVHIRHQLMLGAIPDFYRGGTHGESAIAFTVRNSRNFFNLFSPIEIRSTAVFLVVIVLLGTAAAWILLRNSRGCPGDGTLSGASVVFAIVMVLELLVASLARKYPFGGLLRHQYIAGPFLLIAAFVLLDDLVSRLGSIMRRAIPAVVLAAIVLNLVVEWPTLIVFPGVVLLTEEYNAWHAAFPNTHAVYLDHWGVIGYFIHTRDRPRRFVRRIKDLAHIDQYHVPDGVEIFYDKTRDNLDLSDPSVYRSFASCLRDSGVGELSLFFFLAGDKPFEQSPHDLENLIVQKAAEQGLIASKVVAGPTTAFADFKLRID